MLLRSIFLTGVFFAIATQGHAQTLTRIAATFDYWTATCITPPKTCEMVQVQTVKDQPNPVGQITVKRTAKDQPYRIFFQVPANVWLQAGIKLTTRPNETPMTAQFKWCVPARCLADTDLPGNLIDKFRKLTEAGEEQFKDATERDVSIPVSFKGFGPALDWMEKQ